MAIAIAIWCWTVTALANPWLLVERGLVAHQLEKHDEARALALEALEQAPALKEAQELYLAASAGAGLGSRALIELAELPEEPGPWHDTVTGLRAAIDSDDFKAVRAHVEQLKLQWPELAILWQPLFAASSAKLAKYRTKLLAQELKSKVVVEHSTVRLYQLRRLLISAGQWEDTVALRLLLTERGEAPPPARPPLGRVQRPELAYQLAKSDEPELPLGYPSELVDVVSRMSRTYLKGKRTDPARAAFDQLRARTDHPHAWTGEAEVWMVEAAYDEAILAATAGLRAATAPRRVDLAVRDEGQRRTHASEALWRRAQARAAAGDLPGGLVDLTLAHLLAEAVLDDGLAERVDEGNTALLRSLEERYRYRRLTPWQRAVQRAERSDDLDAAGQHLANAMLLIAGPTRAGMRMAERPGPYLEPVATVLHTRARVAVAQSDLVGAREAAVLATLLHDDAPAEWWSLRANIHDRLGEPEAAFAAFAEARRRGASDVSEGLARNFEGLGAWERAAPAPLPDATAAPGPTPGASPRPAPAAPRAALPAKGKPFPHFSVPTERGELSTRDLPGRILIISFWRASCDPCLNQLPALGSMARKLRGSARDAVLIGVNLDEAEADFRRVERFGEGWGQLVRAPRLAAQFGVDALPTTIVVDAEGITRVVVEEPIDAPLLEARFKASLP